MGGGGSGGHRFACLRRQGGTDSFNCASMDWLATFGGGSVGRGGGDSGSGSR